MAGPGVSRESQLLRPREKMRVPSAPSPMRQPLKFALKLFACAMLPILVGVGALLWWTGGDEPTERTMPAAVASAR